MEDKYIVLFSCKGEDGVVNDHPLRSFILDMEAECYLTGYVDAIINHTDEKNRDQVKGLFRIAKIGEEYAKEKAKEDTSETENNDSVDEVSSRV